LFGKTYGMPDGDGISATEHEFDYATELGKDRVVYFKQLTPRARQAKKMAELIAKAKEAVTYNTFNSLDELKLKVMQSLLFWQQNQSKMGGIGK
jgi:hypothetical protein